MGNESLVQRARNRLVADALSFNTMTHILFIDADSISWNPNDVLKLLLQNKDVVGVAYPFKHYFLDRITPEFLQEMERRNQGPYNKEIKLRKFYDS